MALKTRMSNKVVGSCDHYLTGKRVLFEDISEFFLSDASHTKSTLAVCVQYMYRHNLTEVAHLRCLFQRENESYF